jgi:hypothetical protein
VFDKKINAIEKWPGLKKESNKIHAVVSDPIHTETLARGKILAQV